MERNRKLLMVRLAVAGSAIPVLLWAYEYGPDPGHCGVPGEGASCIASTCHTGTANDPKNKGCVSVVFPGADQRCRRAVIQMASSLRNLGNAREAVTLLTAKAGARSDDLDGAVATFLALALADVGREREALAVALTALSKYLPRYNRSVARYARALTEQPP